MSADQQTPASVVERLRRTSRNTCGMETDTLVNPDGHEAAAWIERLSAEREGLREAAQVLETSEWEFTGNERASKAFADLRLLALTQGESRQTGWQDMVSEWAERIDAITWSVNTSALDAVISEMRQAALPAAPTPADGGGG